jgi:hypothetical protein
MHRIDRTARIGGDRREKRGRGDAEADFFPSMLPPACNLPVAESTLNAVKAELPCDSDQ